MITQCAADSVITPIRPNVFLGPQSTRFAADQLLGYLKSDGKTKIARHARLDRVRHARRNIIKADAAKYGITSVDEQVYDLNSTTFIPQLTKIKNSDAQAIISWGSGAPAVTITKEYRQLGISIPLALQRRAGEPTLSQAHRRRRQWDRHPVPMAPIGKYLPDSNPSKALITKFDADFMAAYNTPPAQFAYNTYDAIQLFVNAIKKAGSRTPRRSATPSSRRRASSAWTAPSTTPRPTTPASALTTCGSRRSRTASSSRRSTVTGSSQVVQ